MPVALGLELSPLELSSIKFGMCHCSCFDHCLHSYLWVFIHLLRLLRDTMSQLNTWFSGTYNLSSSTMFPEWKVKELFCRSTHWDWAPQLCVFFGCFLQWSSSIPKKGSVGERWELNLSVVTMFSIWSVNNDYAGLVE